MSTRFTGPFQKTPQEQQSHLKIACAPTRGPSWTLRSQHNWINIYSDAPYGIEANTAQDTVCPSVNDNCVDQHKEPCHTKNWEVIKLPNDRWKQDPHTTNVIEQDSDDRRMFDIGIDRKTWEILSSAPFVEALLMKKVRGIQVHFKPLHNSHVRREGSGLNQSKMFGLLLDENRKAVTPGTTFLARNVFSDAGLSYVSRIHRTWDMDPDFISYGASE